MNSLNAKPQAAFSVPNVQVSTQRILVVDDDPLFCRIMASLGEKMGITVEHRSSLRELYRVLPDLKFDVAIVDYDLGKITGVQLSQHIERVAKGKPVVLVSNYSNIPTDGWSPNVRLFVSKREGEQDILRKAVYCLASKHA